MMMMKEWKKRMMMLKLMMRMVKVECVMNLAMMTMKKRKENK